MSEITTKSRNTRKKNNTISMQNTGDIMLLEIIFTYVYMDDGKKIRLYY